MSLNIIVGRAGRGKTRYCLDEIKNKLLQMPEGNPLIMIVPEQATFQLERELASDSTIEGFTRAYVLGFRRLAHRVLLETGGGLRPHISELGKKLVLNRLLSKRQGELKIFNKAAQEVTFAESLAQMIQEFKAYGISPEDLAGVQQEMEPSVLKDKLHDLQLVYEDFAAFLYGKYIDPEDILTMLAEKIPMAALLHNAEVWVDGFSWFTPCERAVLREIMLVADRVTVTLCLDQPHSVRHAAETSLLHRQWVTYGQIKQLANELTIPVQETELKEHSRFAERPLLQHVETEFFQLPSVPFSDSCDGLKLVEAANRRVEVDGMARDMIRLCREEGLRWRDIAVLIRDTEGYADHIDTVLNDYAIPFFSDQHRRVVHHPLAELLRSSLEVIESHWDYEPVFRALKTDFFDMKREEVDKLENYVLEFGIRGARWTNDVPWSFLRRFSLDEDEEETVSQQQTDYLKEMNDLRYAAMLPLRKLGDSINKARTAEDLTRALYDFLVLLKAPEKLAKWADRAEESGELELAREHRQVVGNIFDLFDQFVETLGEQEMSLTEYIELLNDGLNGLELSIIPPGLDYVAVAGLERARIDHVKAVYVLGVNEGILPARSHNEGLLNDEDRNAILAAGLEIAPGNLSNVFAEQFLVYTALTRASQYLWVSYALADEEGKAMTPSLIIRRLKELAPKAVIKSLPVEPEDSEAKEYVAREGQTLSVLVSMLNLCKKGTPLSPVWRDVYNWSIVQKEAGAKLKGMIAGLFYNNQAGQLPGYLSRKLYLKDQRLLGSVTRFESFRACPFKHFVRYGLGLKERAVFKLSAPDYGRFLHAALKEFGERAAQENKNWGDYAPERRDGMCEEIVAELTPKLQNEILMSSAQYQHLAGRLGLTVKRAVGWLAEFDKVSSFKPVVLEQPFGRGKGCWPALSFDLKNGNRLELAGQIDRVDALEHDGTHYILVLDYKSGGAWMKLPDVFYGIKLQLLTYLLTVCTFWGEEDCCPAGILYFFLKNPSVVEKNPLDDETVEKKIHDQLKMPGWILNDLTVAQMLDHHLDSTSDFLKLGLKKDQTFKKTCGAYLKTREEFELLLKHVEKVLTVTADEVLDGQNDISPYRLGGEDACNRCDFHAVCQFDLLLPGNNYRQLADLADEIVLQRLSEKGDDTR
ncbi:MAG TPA: helicase-exonuclease AddAB subunit AddB [Ruminiclostridium sp.]|nr:helicase-exonuclease AddAB subunit AddB [Ruminiclostridium sp.]